jgi:hypothetical protein
MKPAVEESKTHYNGLPPKDSEADSKGCGFVNANIYQAAILNRLLPAGFKIELENDVQRNAANRKSNALQMKSKQQQQVKKKKVRIYNSLTLISPITTSFPEKSSLAYREEAALWVALN